MGWFMAGWLGAGIACLCIIVIEAVRYVRLGKRLDRQFDLEVAMRDQERAARLRAGGMSEEDIADLQRRIDEERSTHELVSGGVIKRIEPASIPVVRVDLDRRRNKGCVMWKVKFTLGKTLPNGDKVVEQVIAESGFANPGQAEAWLAVGAKLSYGPEFWTRVQKIEVLQC